VINVGRIPRLVASILVVILAPRQGGVTRATVRNVIVVGIVGGCCRILSRSLLGHFLGRKIYELVVMGGEGLKDVPHLYTISKKMKSC
jgi:hypothetical protein